MQRCIIEFHVSLVILPQKLIDTKACLELISCLSIIRFQRFRYQCIPEVLLLDLGDWLCSCHCAIATAGQGQACFWGRNDLFVTSSSVPDLPLTTDEYIEAHVPAISLTYWSLVISNQSCSVRCNFWNDSLHHWVKSNTLFHHHSKLNWFIIIA